jgi:hypothetical protein
MTGPSSPIAGHAIIKALDSDLEDAAEDLEDGERRAALDEEELHELEEAEFAAVTPSQHPAPAAAVRRRTFLDRVLRR